jgi:hypothetical protein
LREIKFIFATAALGLCLTTQAQTPSTQPAGADATPESRTADRGAARGRNFSQTQMQRVQEALQASDDEWKVIEPRIEKIESIRRAIQGSRFGNRTRRGNPNNVLTSPAAPTRAPAPAPATDQTELQTASQQLQEALNNKDTKPQELKARLATLREARAQALAELTKAQDDLRDILTARQEAVLVTFGLLN